MNSIQFQYLEAQLKEGRGNKVHSAQACLLPLDTLGSLTLIAVLHFGKASIATEFFYQNFFLFSCVATVRWDKFDVAVE